jgi:hypothetical protein
MPKYNNLCNWQPKNHCLVKPPPPCPTPVGCNKDVAEVYFTITDTNLLTNYNLVNFTINTYNCGYVNLLDIGIKASPLQVNHNPFRIGPLYLKFCDYGINGRYSKKNQGRGDKCFDNVIVKIDQCSMEIPIDQKLYDCL